MVIIRRRPVLGKVVAACISLLCISLFVARRGEAAPPECDLISLLLGRGPTLGDKDISFDGQTLQVKLPKCLKELENELPKGARGSLSEAFQIGFQGYV